jgi:2-isopropylmalate synthase (EC 2.3.3.13)
MPSLRFQFAFANRAMRSRRASIASGRHRGPQIYSGYSANTDTIVAAAESYMTALNKMIAARQERLSAENAAYAAGYDRNKPTYAVDLFGKNATE